MKQLIFFTVFITLMYGCTKKVNLSKEIPGAYILISQSIQHGQETNTLGDLRQLKIYTDSNFMYTQINPSDSSAAFGVGNYSTNSDSLDEHVIYSSSDSSFNNQPINHSLHIDITPQGYNQIINDIVINKQHSKLTEHYQRVKSKETSPLDGVWKEQRSFLLKGNDTTFYNRTQYKSFFDGYFMFGNTVKENGGKTTTGMGYGTFKMVNESQFSETDLNSSNPFVAGNTFTIDLVKPNKDHFQQTIKNNDGSTSVEYYERIK